jgi:CheY-like chemotaxis protein
MDLSLIKQKLADSQTKGKPREKIDYSKIFWKPKPGKHQVRILPSKFDKANPFREIYLHYGFSKGPILALTNWGEKDPIVEFTKQLRKSSDKEDWHLAKKIEPKIRYFAPVIVRGEEDKGARLWEFGKLTYEQLLGIASDEDYGDYTDISEGRDFTIDAVEDTVANRKVVKCNLRVKPKTTPISEDGALVEKLLEEQPDILAINKRYAFEDLQEVLNKWLNPEETAEESETPVASATAEDEETTVGNAPWEKEETKPTPAYSLKTDAAKKSHADEFDSLFDE